MAEYDSGSLHIINTKLQNLHVQVESALSDDLSNKDVKAALERMRENLTELMQHVGDAVSYSRPTKEQIALAASEHITLHSAVLGFVIRSSTTRNPFELYYSFKQISRRFFADEDVYLILSSEWNYVPFTYPMTLDDLPNFILIGMPAPEADNVLAFPLAGHELGHSIWKEKSLTSLFSGAALEKTKSRFEAEPELLKALYPNVSEEEFESDLFASRLKDSTISQIIKYCLLQMEEVFCDIIGIKIFGPAYLHAFRYLLAPTQSRERSLVYPELSERAKILDEYLKGENFELDEISKWFTREDDISHPFYAALVRICDAVRRELFDDLCIEIDKIIVESGLPKLRPSIINHVSRRFLQNMPVEGDTSLGELICGAWDFYRTSFDHPIGMDSKMEAAASNLVLKSAEAMEFKARMSLVS